MYKIGDRVRGKVTGIEDYGIFLLLDDKTVGLIHISEISDYFVKNIEDYAKIDDTIEAEIIEIDEDKNQLKLSLKRMNNGNHKKIVETKSGFSTLKEKLDDWIKEKLN